jgi:ABC-type transporter Mla MlaB component
MLRIQRMDDDGGVRFMLSGRLDDEYLPELRRLIEAEEPLRPLTLDLRDVKLVDREAVRFLAEWEASDVTLANCPQYVREWIVRERASTRKRPRKIRSRREPER